MKITMKQLVFLALFLCVHSAAGLTCFSCEDNTCSSSPAQKNCKETLCFSSNISGSDSDSNATRIIKGCAPSEVCPSKGTFSFSFNIRSASVLGSVLCCDTDNCNAANASVQTPSAGPLKCCAGTDKCTSDLTCNTLETRCFSAQVQNQSMAVQAFGCISENLCNEVGLSSLFLGVDTQQKASCCNSTNCNSSAPALSATLPPLVLLCSLLGLIFTHVFYF